MTATAMAKRLAADTPALRANDTSVPLTGRQREIIALTLAAAVLTNRQIADPLMSVRTVDGHLFRAAQKTGSTAATTWSRLSIKGGRG